MHEFCREIAAMIDLSLLRPELTVEDIQSGCATARKYEVATVCCAPCHVSLVRELLDGSPVKTSTVVGFPLGYSLTETKLAEASLALSQGAEELDMVLNISCLLGGSYDYVQCDIETIVHAAHDAGALVKVIFENCYLTKELIVTACRLSEAAGADFVKTSTGFGTGGALFDDIRLMRSTVSPDIQVKAAGGIRDLDAVLTIRELGCTRFGCTVTESIMDECIRRYPE